MPMKNSSDKKLQKKLELLTLAKKWNNVSKACEKLGVSRDTFYRYQQAFASGGKAALVEKSRRKPNLKNRVPPATERAVVAYALKEPAHGQASAAQALRKRGVAISPFGVRNIWLRHGLGTHPQRLAAAKQKSKASARRKGK